MGNSPAEQGIQAAKKDAAIFEAVKRITWELNQEILTQLKKDGYTSMAFLTTFGEPNSQQAAVLKERKKFYAIDIGSSGAYLIEKATGEIFNIKGYGTADYNKKKKSDIGNVLNVETARVFKMRWNYLR